MTKRQHYGLSFHKSLSPVNGHILHVCKKSGQVDQYNALQIIQQLNQFETQGFIAQIQAALNAQEYEQYFVTDSFEAENIQLAYPNVVFGENDLVIPMVDLAELLQEWLIFIT